MMMKRFKIAECANHQLLVPAIRGVGRKLAAIRRFAPQHIIKYSHTITNIVLRGGFHDESGVAIAPQSEGIIGISR